MSRAPAIRLERLGYSYRRRRVLEGISFDVPRGAFYGLLGPNGSGKSTTIRLLMGMLRASTGSVNVLGLDPRQQALKLKRQVGFIAENPSFYSWMSVTDLMAFVAHYRPEWDMAYAEHLRQRFRLDSSRQVGTMSRGEQAMTGLLLALAFRPPLLIFDEPTSALDVGARQRFFEGVLAEFQDDGGTVFVTSHLIHELGGFVDHVGILDGGQLQGSWSLEQLHTTIRRFRLTYADRQSPQAFSCPGLLTQRSEGRQCAVTLDLSKIEEREARRILEATGPSRLDSEALSLEEIFLAMTAGR